MPAMSQAEIEAFLAEPRHAIVATIHADGTPHMSPVWYLYDGRLYISIPAITVKHRNLQRDPRLSVCIDGCRPDGRTVMFSGMAELLPKGDPFGAEMRWRIIRHYHNSEAEALRYWEQVKDVAATLIIVTPNKVISQNFN
ncbi:MAG: PPOX class F420-dependent oxidoreductase [Chloroflexota bacterium]